MNIKCNKGSTLVEVLVVVVILVILATILIPTLSKYFGTNYTEKIKEEAASVLESAQIVFDGLYADGSHSEDEMCIIPGNEVATNIYNRNIIGNNNKNIKIPNEYDTLYKLNDIDRVSNQPIYRDNECDIHWTIYANKVFVQAGLDIQKDDPCTIIVATGKYSKYTNPDDPDYDPSKAYHVYFVVYHKYLDRNAFILCDNGSYKYSWPFVKKVDDSYVNVSTGNNNQEARENKNMFIDGEEKPIELQFYYIKNGKDNNNNIGSMWNAVRNKLRSSGW